MKCKKRVALYCKYCAIKKLIFLLPLLALSCSHSQKQKQEIDILNMQSIELKTQRINKGEVIARGAYPFVVIDSLFFLFNGDPSSGAVVLNESDASEVCQFLAKGNGFGECFNVDYMGRSKDTLFVYEISTVRKMSYLFSFVDASLRYKCIADIRPKNNSEFYYSVHLLENGLSVGARMSGEKYLFTLLDEKLDSIVSFGKIPVNYTGSNLAAFKGDFIADGNIVYYVGMDFSYMAAYEISDRKVVPKFEKMYVPPVLTSSGDRISFDKYKHLRGFSTLKSYKDYIFATFSGKTVVSKETEGASALVTTTILAFDKQGNPLAKFITPYKIRRIAFTDKKMYLLDLDCNIESIDMDEVLKYMD